MNKPISLALVIAVLPVSAWGACERSDVDHYLSKGFSPDQITVLCGADKTTAQPPAVEEPATAQTPVVVETTPAPVAAEPAKAKPGLSAAEENARVLGYLQSSLDVDSVEFEGEALQVSQSLKVKYGEKDIFGNFPVVRPQIISQLDLPSLRVIKTRARIPLLRGASILVSGDIDTRIVDSEQYTQEQLAGIRKELEDAGNNALNIPVNKKASLDRVNIEFQTLGERYRR